MAKLDLHGHFLETAARLSAPLRDDLAALGPVWFPEREDHGVAAFLGRAVIGQQVSAAAARTIWGRIERAAAETAVPLAGLFAEAHAATLKSCGASGPKVKALIGIGAADAAGDLSRERLVALEPECRTVHLMRIWGVGQWTCDMLSIFYFRELDTWPEGDLAVQRAFRRYIGRRKPARAAAAFAPYRSILALYMWRLAGGAV